MHRLMKTVALACPTQKVRSLPRSDPHSTSIALKSLQLQLDQELQQAYTRKSQTFLDKKINISEIIHPFSRLIR
ncbi:MAG: hypothetical protein K0R24_2246 [Gammaproteobacteria bacterium]|nr:hypothetical protein [Gammaproteobacteria bacterium]